MLAKRLLGRCDDLGMTKEVSMGQTPTAPRVDALVLAGGSGEPIDGKVGPKGLVLVAGKPMVQWVVEALLSATTVDSIAVVLPNRSVAPDFKDERVIVVVSDGSLMDNVQAGLDALDSSKSVLALSGDIPALTSAAIDDYVTQSLQRGVELSYPLISKASMEAQFPGSVRTYVTIKGGPVTGGNIIVGSPELAAKLKDLFQEFYDTRKNPVKWARIVGFGFVIKLALGILDPTDVERRLSKVFGGPVAAIYSQHACIGADVDKPVDLEVIERVLGSST